jgi:hypothetical protein
MKAISPGIFAVTLGLLALTAEAPQAAETFALFVGSWAGSGTIAVKDGARERIRCRGTNTESGNSLKLGLKCASDSYRFELQSDIINEGGSVSGSWNETTRGVVGSLSGRMSSGRIQATAQSVGFSASLSILSSGGRQSVSIRSPGSEISEVSISLARAGR